MTNAKSIHLFGLGLVAALVALAAGCGDTTKPAATPATPTPGKTAATTDEKKDGDTKHSGWWCTEHGIPEADCSMCSAKVAKACKDKGDWCATHERAKSQCFHCDPKLKEKFAAQYRTKYGKEPPPTEDDEKGGKKDDVKK